MRCICVQDNTIEEIKKQKKTKVGIPILKKLSCDWVVIEIALFGDREGCNLESKEDHGPMKHLGNNYLFLFLQQRKTDPPTTI